MTVAITTVPGGVNVALVQIAGAGEDKDVTNEHMREMVRRAMKEGEERGAPLHIVVLPEMWNSPVGVDWFAKMSEVIPEVGTPVAKFPVESKTVAALSAAAAEAKVWLIGGSIPEQRDGKFHNCATIWNPEGELVKTYRKLHMFDICLPTMTYKESDQFTPGSELGFFETPFGKFGIAICYDLRFPELATIAGRNGAMAMFYPAAFNMTTGPLHWELLQRARALDNQIYVCTASPARDVNASYIAYGHSLCVSPMGAVMATAEADETIIHVTFDPKAIETARAGIPVSTQRRFDMYVDVANTAVTA